MLHVAFHCIYTFLEPNSHTQTSVQNLTQNTFLYSKFLMTLSHTVFIVITHYYFPLVQPLAEEKGKQSMHSLTAFHQSLRASLGFYLYDEGKSRTPNLKVDSTSFLLYTSFSLSFPFFNGHYKTIKKYPRWLSQGLPTLWTKAAHSHKSWLPFPQYIPDMKTINLMRTTSPNEVCVLGLHLQLLQTVPRIRDMSTHRRFCGRSA